MTTVTPFLWFDNQAEEAAKFYISVFNNAKIISLNPMFVEMEIEGQRLQLLNGGPVYKFNEAISLFVNVETQEDVDRLWGKLIEGGSEGECGWLKDKYGLSWQIVPHKLRELLFDSDKVKAGRVMQAMLKMKKIIISDLQKAYDADN